VGDVELMNPAMLERMRASCQLAADCLVMVGTKIRVGMTTDEINTLVHEFITQRDAYPSPLNYKPGGAPRAFPKSVCTSLNEVVCHGIPGKQALKGGDIVNVDVTTYFKGHHGSPT
jgi:methionyl aminopeptidase